MQKYQCMACGWIYDPAENNNIPFEEQKTGTQMTEYTRYLPHLVQAPEVTGL